VGQKRSEPVQGISYELFPRFRLFRTNAMSTRRFDLGKCRHRGRKRANKQTLGFSQNIHLILSRHVTEAGTALPFPPYDPYLRHSHDFLPLLKCINYGIVVGEIALLIRHPHPRKNVGLRDYPIPTKTYICSQPNLQSTTFTWILLALVLGREPASRYGSAMHSVVLRSNERR
jgi:hypothetical protein